MAERYDERFTDTAIGRALRAEVWRRLDRRLEAGSRVLDVGCGTGADALHMAERGLSVMAIDPSAAMIALARRRAEAGGLPATRRPRFVCAGASDVPRLVAEGQGFEGGFDGVLANFGVLNCLSPEALRDLAAALAGLLVPGGIWMSVTMGPFCAWELAWYGLRGDGRRALRRRLRPASADLGAGRFPVHYHSTGAVAAAARPWFEPVERAAIGALVPPVFAGGWLADRPAVLDRLVRLERHLAERAPVRAIADHVLLTLERRGPVPGPGGP